ncbi:MAG: hypothetical protein KatS3mg038_2125 [Candidatus Kapaibacterium sp.]|nr:MAG: hypothetical protein KatS3mg038_2125 [Candidatus Kapabacteria bacterium]
MKLYPRMRERPPEFRLNPQWPLYASLVYAFLPAPTQKECPDVLWRNPPTVLYGNARIEYSPFLRRFVAVCDTTSDYCASYPLTTPLPVKFTWSCWIFPTNYSGTHRGSVCNFANGIAGFTSDKNIGISDTGVPYAYIYTGAPQRANGPYILQQNTWGHVVGVNSIGTLGCALNGTYGTKISVGLPQSTQTPFAVTLMRSWDGPQTGMIADALLFNDSHENAILALADPDNVDLRVGGVPLILPPRRRSWPGITITTQDEVITLPTLLAEC